MSFKTIDELARLLVVHLKLVKPMQLKRCSDLLGSRYRDPADLLNMLERERCLTPYQLHRLRAGHRDRLLVARYKLLELRAQGTRSDVYCACSVRDERVAALKLLKPRWWNDENAVAQFHLRSELAAHLKHWNVASVYSVGCHENEHFVAMEYAQRGNFRDVLASGTPFSSVQATRAALDISEGLYYARSRGFVHGDLRLSNVLCNRHGVAKLANFALAGNQQIIHERLNGRMRERSPNYFALEEGTDVRANDSRSDLFFLGAIYYELLTGTPPLPRQTDGSPVSFHQFTVIPPIESVAPDLPAVVTRIVNRTLQLAPGHRYQSLDAVLDDLRTALTELSPDDDPEQQPLVSREPFERESKQVPTVICIENRPERQKILQEYFSRHGFRVLVLADLQRGLSRLVTSPPDCILLMGDSIGDDLVEGFSKAVQLGNRNDVVSIAVLSPDQAAFKDDFEQSNRSRVLLQPVALPTIRQEIKQALQTR